MLSGNVTIAVYNNSSVHKFKLYLKPNTQMKKFFSKPGFEFMFSLSLIAILALPPVLLAQNQKKIEIKIQNGDTSVNGKNIKDLSTTERQNALKDIEQINGDHQNVYFKRKDTSGGKTQFYRFRVRQRDSGEREMITETRIFKDSLGNIVAERRGPRKTIDPKMSFRYRDFEDSPDRMELRGRNFGTRPRGLMSPFERRNSQNFDYVKTDNEGISTHVRFHVSEASDDDLKKIPHVEGSKTEISDLNLAPEFSTGKTLLMFNLPAKTPADVKLLNSEGKLVWGDKAAGGSFSKKFVLNLNGIYYLQVKQGNSISIKKIIKEE